MLSTFLWTQVFRQLTEWLNACRLHLEQPPDCAAALCLDHRDCNKRAVDYQAICRSLQAIQGTKHLHAEYSGVYIPISDGDVAAAVA